MSEFPGRAECRGRAAGRGSVSQRRTRSFLGWHWSAGMPPPGCAVVPPRVNPPERWMSLRPSRRGGRVGQKKHELILRDGWSESAARPPFEEHTHPVPDLTCPLPCPTLGTAGKITSVFCPLIQLSPPRSEESMGEIVFPAILATSPHFLTCAMGRPHASHGNCLLITRLFLRFAAIGRGASQYHHHDGR